MRLSLSTNWCNRRLASGEEIADVALALGFDELELGFHTTPLQVRGIRARLDRMPVGSVHAFCPVPLSAPQGHPELYQLASRDEEARKMARLQVARNVAFAAEMGADAVVLHAGRVAFGSFFDRIDSTDLLQAFADNGCRPDAKPYAQLLARARRRRAARGRKALAILRGELAALVPVLEKHHVTLALENLPYLEGFPAEDELTELLAGEFRHTPVRGWFDTGHARVRQVCGWAPPALPDAGLFAGMHLNDVAAFEDDHLAPGDGSVDFAALGDFAAQTGHVVFEPNPGVSEASLRRGIEHIRRCWNL
ncbi:MAG: sugar phosphate isomerase/epimerase family protein [Kiritimatiellia bacterium]